jgi:hypothetical protein
MRVQMRGFAVLSSFTLLAGFGMPQQVVAQGATTHEPAMAPVAQYLMADRAAEIALARSAAPASIARDAEVQVLGRHGFETAVKGTNGFVCIVGRSWTAAADEDYGDPKVRVPMCMNAAAARSYFLRVTAITNLALQGRTLADSLEQLTQFVIPVDHWSDGTPATSTRADDNGSHR